MIFLMLMCLIYIVYFVSLCTKIKEVSLCTKIKKVSLCNQQNMKLSLYDQNNVEFRIFAKDNALSFSKIDGTTMTELCTMK